MGLISRFLDWLAGPLKPSRPPLYSGENDRFDQPATEAPRVYRSPRPPQSERRPVMVVPPHRTIPAPRQDDSHVLPLTILLATQAASDPAPTYSPPSCDSSASYDSGSSSCDGGGSGW